MSSSSILRATACAILLAFTPACSALFVTGPDESTMPYREPVKCTSAPAAPLFDALVAALGTVLLVGGIDGVTDGTETGKNLGGVALLFGGTIGLTFGASAYGGFSQVHNCNQAKAQVAKARGGGAPAPRAQAAYLP
jgi:hypothetical protein